jgi:hypothetical protein
MKEEEGDAGKRILKPVQALDCLIREDKKMIMTRSTESIISGNV